MQFHEHKIVSVEDLIPYALNSRTHSDAQVAQLAASIREFGFTNPVLVDEANNLIAGHGRLLAARKLKMEKIPAVIVTGLDDRRRRALVIADNKLALNAGWDEDALRVELEDLAGDFGDLMGFSEDELAAMLAGPEEEKYAEGVAGSMSANYGQPPFSVLDTRKGDWLERKRIWREQISDNGESREGTLGGDGIMSGMNNGVSLLDPVLSEIIVAWFGVAGGVAVDPFAGDTVFGFVAGSKGMGFKGIELRQEQVDLNQARCDQAGLPCKYYCDTSENIDNYVKDGEADLIFSCPPYADLEVYSEDPNDLSNMSHENFFEVYKRILASTFAKLKDNRFAVIVMGEVRGKSGSYIGTIPKTIEIMEGAGFQFYNEIVLINPAGTLPLRAGKSMQASRKVGKMHQNVLVFLKGDAKEAVGDLGEISISFGDANEDDG